MQICADHPLLEVWSERYCDSPPARRCSPERLESSPRRVSGVTWGLGGGPEGFGGPRGGSVGPKGVSVGTTGVSVSSTGSWGAAEGADGAVSICGGGDGEAVADASLLLTSPVDEEESEEMLESGVTEGGGRLWLLARGEVGMAPLGFFVLAEPSLNVEIFIRIRIFTVKLCEFCRNPGRYPGLGSVSGKFMICYCFFPSALPSSGRVEEEINKIFTNLQNQNPKSVDICLLLRTDSLNLMAQFVRKVVSVKMARK